MNRLTYVIESRIFFQHVKVDLEKEGIRLIQYYVWKLTFEKLKLIKKCLWESFLM